MGKGFERWLRASHFRYCTILSPTLFHEIWQINHKQFSVFFQSSPSSCSFFLLPSSLISLMLCKPHYRISSPISWVIFQYLTQKFEIFFTRNGIQLIAEGLGFKTITNLMLMRNDRKFRDCSALYVMCF